MKIMVIGKYINTKDNIQLSTDKEPITHSKYIRILGILVQAYMKINDWKLHNSKSLIKSLVGLKLLAKYTDTKFLKWDI